MALRASKNVLVKSMMNFIVRIRVAFLALAVLSCASGTATAPQQEKSPKSIILIIGDGMGPAQFTAARILRGSEFQSGRLPVSGLVRTRSANSVLTDSAAAATAYATGVKTDNRMLGVDPNGFSHPTVLEIAEARGMATGLVTTTDFWDATPAAFASHVKDRREAKSIASQMLRHDIDIIASSGVEKFGVEGNPPLPELARDNGYTLVGTAEELETAKGSQVLAVFRSSALDVDSPDIRLPALAAWAIERLSKDPDGFFLLLEHEGTDSTAHNGATALFEISVRSLDETVGVALEFVNRHKDVLLIVTGDHETGGLQIQGPVAEPLQLKWTTGGHTAQPVPIFSQGPGSGNFSGLLDNTDVGRKLLALVRNMGSKR